MTNVHVSISPDEFRRVAIDRRDVVGKWLRENEIVWPDYGYERRLPLPTSLVFKNAADAVAFKMRWLS